ncbi:MAG: tetratricopeptide repeat protein [Planctomycetes bacterium]|nr:tetratricopeptide repeat protein [Planctomycetota bacterium]
MSKKRRRGPSDEERGWNRFEAEAAYAQSIFRFSLKDVDGAISALAHSLKALPTYAPAIMSMGSVEYQRGKRAQGHRLFLSLLNLPDKTPDLCECIDRAGDFLIQEGKYKAGLELYRKASERFPKVAVFRQGIGCCAGHLRRYDEAVAASRAAVALEPKNQKFVNDLGWSLYQAGHAGKALPVLGRAVTMNPKDRLAAENLRICLARVDDDRRRAKKPQVAPVRVRRADRRRESWDTGKSPALPERR